MKLKLIVLFALPVLATASAQDVTGDWHGLLPAPGMKLRLVFHIQSAEGGYTATMDSPDQNASGIPVQEVQFNAPELLIRMPNIMLEYRGTLDAATGEVRGTFSQGGANIPLVLRREAVEKPVVRRPQHPEPPYPYYVEEIRFPNADAGIELAGALTLPAREGTFPVVVLISGSGPQNRDEEILGHKPFLVLADHLTRQGIGVLRYDERGVGRSTGTFSTATSADLASDVEAAIRYLKTCPGVDPRRIGLIGHSEGGLIAPMVAARSKKDVAFLVLLAGPGVPGADVILRQSALIGRAEGQPDDIVNANIDFLREAFEQMRGESDVTALKEQLRPRLRELLRTAGVPAEAVEQQAEVQLSQITSPWYRFFITYDPAPALRQVRCPVLALTGGNDLQVDPAQNLPAIEAALKKGKNRRVTTRVLPGLNHLFQTSATGKLSEYGNLEETFAPAALNAVSEWIRAQVK